MKTLTCKQLGGPCDHAHQGETADELVSVELHRKRQRCGRLAIGGRLLLLFRRQRERKVDLGPLLGCEAVKGGGNNARWCNKQFEDIVIKAAQTPKQADRAKLYEQAQVIFKQQEPWLTLAHAVQLKPVRKEVIDFKLSPFGRHNFYGVDIKE